MLVYLSGGMKSGWQDVIMQTVTALRYIDPRQHGLDNPDQYTLWDLEGVRQCDIVFAYLETSNPSGIGLALEIGYAKALGKQIILVDEQQDRRFAIARSCANVVLSTLDDGLTLLRSMERLHVA